MSERSDPYYQYVRPIGAGGFGIVFLAIYRGNGNTYAIKTFRDEFLADPAARQRFKQEALLWVNFGSHPNIVRAFWVDEIACRLHIVMEYIFPGKGGFNSLQGCFERCPPDLAQGLRWAIGVCDGMEYARSKGLTAHRDLKPSNLMITHDNRIKISDFGLASILAGTSAGPMISVVEGHIGLSCQSAEGEGFGTPTHMPPEQFADAVHCDVRSDIYAMGIILYQLASKGRLPFLADPPRNFSAQEQMRFWREMAALHRTAPLPYINSPIAPIIQRCLAKYPQDRYPHFSALRADLAEVLLKETKETIPAPQPRSLTAQELVAEGSSLDDLGKAAEALQRYERAIDLDPNCALAWNNKGKLMNDAGDYQQAILCFQKARALKPEMIEPYINQGNSHRALKQFSEAKSCFRQALKMQPQNAYALNNLGAVFADQDLIQEALNHYNQAIQYYPRYLQAWHNRANAHRKLGDLTGALADYDRILEIDPADANALYLKSEILITLNRFQEALSCCEKALHYEPQNGYAISTKSHALLCLGRWEESLVFSQKAISLDTNNPAPWYYQACALDHLEKPLEAIASYEEFIKRAQNCASQYKKTIEQAKLKIQSLRK
ncbi:MAG: tetratricopeptide repeat protein [Anaerolineae bacterium]|nr:tetratricopeptide repeat protein [Anaerolineae bacterium]